MMAEFRRRAQVTNRRLFLKQLAGTAAFPAIVPASVLGRGGFAPGSKINLGCIGVGRMGSNHVQGFLQHEDVRLVAICDVQKSRRDEAKAVVDQAYGDSACATYNDFRELLARPDIDAVMMAATEHWHALIGIEAARRGKHIYYEKPMAMTVAECQAVRRAVNQYGVVFQFGTLQRSMRDYRFTCELIRNGYIGQLQTIMIGSPGGNYSRMKQEEIKPVPPGVDWDMWLGPAPLAPYSDERISLTWQWISDYGYGSIDGAWGVHDVDIAQWVNETDHTGPVEVEGEARYYDDIRDAPYSWTVEHKYANGVRLIHMDMANANKRAPQFKLSNYMCSVMSGTEGWIMVSRRGMMTHPVSLMHTVIRPSDKRVINSPDHRRNFLDAIKARQATVAPLEAAVRADTICHQALIALRLGRKLRWDPSREVFLDDADANRLLSRSMRSPWRL
jgi:predicted dehydrogenase